MSVDWCPSVSMAAHEKAIGNAFYYLRRAVNSSVIRFDSKDLKFITECEMQQMNDVGIKMSCYSAIQEGFMMYRQNQKKSLNKRDYWGALVSGIGVRMARLRGLFSQPIDFTWWSQQDSNPRYRREIRTAQPKSGITHGDVQGHPFDRIRRRSQTAYYIGNLCPFRRVL